LMYAEKIFNDKKAFFNLRGSGGEEKKNSK
jgi:hypothetical protein